MANRDGKTDSQGQGTSGVKRRWQDDNDDGQKDEKKEEDDVEAEAEESTSKRSKQAPPDMDGEDDAPTTTLLDLSDHVLLLIFGNLPCSYDLVHLAATCRRLDRVCRDRSLWVSVVAGREPSSSSSSSSHQSLREIRRLLPFLHAETRSVCVRGNLGLSASSAGVARREVVSPSLLRECARLCPQLERLALERCFVDANKVTLDMMPATLTALSLADCEVVNVNPQESYFKGADEVSKANRNVVCCAMCMLHTLLFLHLGIRVYSVLSVNSFSLPMVSKTNV